MLQEEVFKKFEDMFPQYANHVVNWFQNGKNSVRVRMDDGGGDFAFTYNNAFDWRFETIHSFINSMKGGCKMNVGLYDSHHERK